jgi:hypothetical protein
VAGRAYVASVRRRSRRLAGLAFYAALAGAFVVSGHSGRNAQQAEQAAVSRPVRCVDVTEHARETGSAVGGRVTSRIVQCPAGYSVGRTYYVDATIGDKSVSGGKRVSRRKAGRITSAASSRPPTYREREAITKALPRGIRQTPVECLWLDIRVSSINPRYAEVGGLYLNAHRRGDLCLRYAHNGGLFLKKGARWRVIFEGTTPPCSTLHIPRDLVGMC